MLRSSAQGVSGNFRGPVALLQTHMLLMPRRSLSSISYFAPARWARLPCPVQSEKNFPRKRFSRLVEVLREVTEMMRPSLVSAAYTCSFRKREMFFSFRTCASFWASPNSSYRPGEFFARSANSSTISPMSGYLPRRMSPCDQTRTSELPLPPSTGRFWMSATLRPWRAAEMALPRPP